MGDHSDVFRHLSIQVFFGQISQKIFCLNFFLFSVSVDRERFEVETFGLVDIQLRRIVYYIYPNREVYFLFICPTSVGDKCPWEVHMKLVHKSPSTYQCHFEFTGNPILPDWYSRRRVSHVDRISVVPIQG